MEFLLCFILFHLPYHIAYHLAFDVFSYHRKLQKELYPSFFRQLFYLFGVPIGNALLLPILFSLTDIPFLLRIIAYLIFGILFLKDIWFMYARAMAKEKDFFYQKYYQRDPFLIRSYCNRLKNIPQKELPQAKLKALQKWIQPYPYRLLMKQSSSINAYADLEQRQIVITKGCFTLSIEEMKAMIAHEIIHLTMNEKMPLAKRKKRIFILLYLIFFSFIPLAVCIKHFAPTYKILFLLLLFLFLFYFLFFHVVMPERYLYQLEELKCDRLACTLEGVTQEAMLSLLKKLKTLVFLPQEPYYLKIIRRYLLLEDHPNMRFRIQQIQHYHAWSIRDYLKLPLHLIKQLCLGKGWNDD